MACFSCLRSISPHFHTTLVRGPETSTSNDAAEKCEIYYQRCYICTEIIIPNGKNIVVASVYRAPNTDLSLLNDHIDYIFNTCKNKKVYLCGDFNVDLLTNIVVMILQVTLLTSYTAMVYIH